MIFKIDFDRELIECIIKNANGHSKHCARNAIYHLERAWDLREIDPEMSVFRAITAKEEAATAIFLSLKEQRYENADKIKFKKHLYKLALEPFLHSIHMFASNISKEPGFPFGSKFKLSLEGKEKDKKLYLSFDFLDGTIKPCPPLSFSIMRNNKPYFFEKELLDITSAKNKKTIIEHVEEIKKRRDQLLYAQPNGIPCASNISGFLEKSRDVVFSFLKIYALIYPYREKAIFVQQALNGFLVMMGEIEESDEGRIA